MRQAGQRFDSRKRRIFVTTAAGVCCRAVRGRDERSSSAATPPCRYRRTHLATVRTLTPVPSATSAYVHRSYSTRCTSVARAAGVVLALRWSFIRGLHRVERLCRNTILPSALRMNNVFSRYS